MAEADVSQSDTCLSTSAYQMSNSDNEGDWWQSAEPEQMRFERASIDRLMALNASDEGQKCLSQTTEDSFSPTLPSTPENTNPKKRIYAESADGKSMSSMSSGSHSSSPPTVAAENDDLLRDDHDFSLFARTPINLIAPKKGPLATTVVKLNNGRSMPAVSFGCGSKWIGKDVSLVVTWALEAGYTHFDTAEIYDNHEYLNKAFQNFLAEHPEKRREDYFFTLKLSDCIDQGQHPFVGVKRILDKLRIGYIDMLMIHSPYEKRGQGRRQRHLNETWARMEDLVEVGLVKSIGVSNFRISDLELIMKMARMKPAVNQVETHASLMQKGLRKFMARHGIVTGAYGNNVPIRHNPNPDMVEFLDKMAAKYDKTPAQILMRFNLERGCQIVTTSSKMLHIGQSADVVNFRLSKEDMDSLIDVARPTAPNERYWQVKCGFLNNTNVW